MNWSYIAGFLDCDGCILISKRKKTSYPSIRVSFFNTNKDVLEKMRVFIGYGNIHENPNNWRGTKTFYYLQCYANAQNLRILRKTIPYLEIKKQKAIEAIEILENRPHPQWGSLRRRPIKEVVNLYLSGKTQKEIGEMFGVGDSTVCEYMRKYGYSAKELRRQTRKRQMN